MAGQLVRVPDRYAADFERYTAALDGSALNPNARRVYASRVRSYLVWLDSEGPGGADQIADPAARKAAVGAYRQWLVEGGRATSTVNAHLTAVDNMHMLLGGTERPVARDRLRRSPRVLGRDEQVRFLAAAQARPRARDRAIALLLYRAGLRLEDLVALGADDVPVRDGQRTVIVRDRDGGVAREIPLADHDALAAIADWEADRASWPGSERNPALFLNRSGGRLSDRAVAQLISAISAEAGLGEDGVSSRVIQNTHAAGLLRGGAGPAEVIRNLLTRAQIADRRDASAAEAASWTEMPGFPAPSLGDGTPEPYWWWPAVEDFLALQPLAGPARRAGRRHADGGARPRGGARPAAAGSPSPG